MSTIWARCLVYDKYIDKITQRNKNPDEEENAWNTLHNVKEDLKSS